MNKRIRPTLDQMKAAMAWWRSLSPIDLATHNQKIREEVRSNTVGADDITRYWLATQPQTQVKETPK